MLAIQCALDACQRLVALFGCQPVLRQLAVQILADGLQTSVNETLLHIKQHDVVSTFGEDVSDTIAHRPCADYAYGSDVHDCLQGVFRASTCTGKNF
jgi:hypothetical protein